MPFADLGYGGRRIDVRGGRSAGVRISAHSRNIAASGGTVYWYSLLDLPPEWEATTRHKESEGSSYYRDPDEFGRFAAEVIER